MAHVRRGDLVVVTKGKDKGRRGKVLRIVGDRVVVERVQMVKRHTKATQQTPQGGIIEKEGTIHISNVQLWDEKAQKGVRTRVVKDGDEKVRVSVKSDTKFPTAGM
jgi:large subunit ribosomal protein L24